MAGEQWTTPQDRLSALPVIEQSLFPAERSKYAQDFERKNALARALNPDYAGLNPEDYVDITYGMVEHVQPKLLAPYLIDVTPAKRDEDNPCQVAYYAGRQLGQIYLAVTPREAKAFPRHVSGIRRAAKITTGATVTTEFPTDSDRAREERSGMHTHENKLGTLHKLRDNVYLPQREMLEKFIEASEGRRFGLARFGNEAKMRQAMATLHSEIFGDMIRAYGRQRDLNESQTKQVQRALMVSVYFDRDNNRHLGHFADLVRFNYAYLGHKLAAAEQRIESIERSLG